jgi:hypothetical protein
MAERLRTEPVYLKMQRMIDVNAASKVINRCLAGEVVKASAERAAYVIFNKYTPSLAAMQLQVAEVKSHNMHDINSLLLTSGVDPAMLFDSLDSSITPEKSIASDVALDPPTPDE